MRLRSDIIGAYSVCAVANYVESINIKPARDLMTPDPNAAPHLNCQMIFIAYKNNVIPTPAAASATATPLPKAAVVDEPDIPVIDGASTLSVGKDGAVVVALAAMRLSLLPDGEEVAVPAALCVPDAIGTAPAEAETGVAPVTASILIAGRLNPVHESSYAE